MRHVKVVETTVKSGEEFILKDGEEIVGCVWDEHHRDWRLAVLFTIHGQESSGGESDG